MHLKLMHVLAINLTNKLRKLKILKIATNTESQIKRIFSEIDPISKERLTKFSEL